MSKLDKLLAQKQESFKTLGEKLLGEFSFEEVPLSLIDPSPNQMRKVFDEEELNELAQSIKKHGLINPIVVSRSNGRYVIESGERRFRAYKLLSTEDQSFNNIPVSITKKEGLTSVLRTFAENEFRTKPNPFERGEFFTSLIERGYARTHRDIADIAGLNERSVTRYIAFSNFSEAIKSKIIEHKLFGVRFLEKLIPLDEEAALQAISDEICGRPIASKNHPQKNISAQSSCILIKSKAITLKEGANGKMSISIRPAALSERALKLYNAFLDEIKSNTNTKEE